ncbi:hypothetical protein ACWCQQ_38585 [Streptomyces sp. NPDC002143]
MSWAKARTHELTAARAGMAQSRCNQEAKTASLPALDVLRRHPLVLLFGIGSSAIGIATAYFFNVFSLVLQSHFVI